MAKEKKVTMPLTTAGLVRYFDEYKEKLQIRPEHVLYFAAGVAIIEILIRFI